MNLTKINDSYDSQINTVNVENQVLKLNINNLKKIIEENEFNQIKEKENKLKELDNLNNIIEEKDRDLNLYVEEVKKVKEDLINFKRNESKLCEENLTLANKLKACLQTMDSLESKINNYESEKSNFLKINAPSGLKNSD